MASMEPQPGGARNGGGGGGGSKPPTVACGFFGDDDERPRKNARARREKKKPSDRGGVAVMSRPAPRESWPGNHIRLIRGVVAESKRVVWPSGSHTVAAMVATLIFVVIVAEFIALIGGAV